MMNVDYIKRELKLNQLADEELDEKVIEIIAYFKYHFDHSEGRSWYSKDGNKTAMFNELEKNIVLKQEFVETFYQKFQKDFDLTTKDIYFYLIGLVTDININEYFFYTS